MHRRQFLKTSGAMLLVCAGAGLGPLLLSRRRVYTMTRPLMGTIGEIHVVSDDARWADRAMEAAFEELQRLESLLTYFSPASDVGRINAAVTGAEIRVAPETADLIERALHWSKVTDGGFEPGLGKVSDTWDVKHRTEPPAQDMWQRFAGLSLHRFIHVTTGPEATVKILSPDVRLDLGGIAKGYAADRAAEVLKKEGITQALINLGGDIVALGQRADGEGWRVGVRDPERADVMATIVTLHDQAIATSGTYEQYFRSGGRVYHHLIDPKLAEPKRAQFQSLTIVGTNGRDTDALATGLFFSTDEDKKKILADHTDRFQCMTWGA